MPETNDLTALKIDRAAATHRRPPGPGRWVLPAGLLALVAGGGWLFQRPIRAWIDSVQLPEVELGAALLQRPGAVGGADGVSSNGYIVARTRAALSADTPGRLVEMNVAEGSFVSANEVVARLYYDEYEAELERRQADLLLTRRAVERSLLELERTRTAEEPLQSTRRQAKSLLDEAVAELEFARSEHARVQHLLEQGIESEGRLDDARRLLDKCAARHAAALAALETADANLVQGAGDLRVAEALQAEAEARVLLAQAARDQAAATLEKTFVRAPFDGVVTRKEAEVGEVVSPNSQGGSTARGSVVTMVDLASLEVQADVPETSLSAVRVGGRARIYLDAWPDQPYEGRVDRIWPTADRQKATVEVRVVFEQRDARLRPEMGVRVVFLHEENEGQADDQAEPRVLVPRTALTAFDGRRGVFVLESDSVRFQALGLGPEAGTRVVVEQGLEGGELVVLDPPADLRDASRVRRKK